MRFAPVGFVLLGTVALAAPPGEVPRDASFGNDKVEWSWSAAAGATAHHVYRGTVPSAHDQACRVFAAAGTSVSLAEAPPPGVLFYFYVSGANADGEGILATDSTGAPVPNSRPCADADDDAIADNLDNCPSDPNPGQADQNEDGIGDRCDPKTYDFEDDVPGTRPAAVTRIGPLDQAFTVKSLGGDLSVSFDQGGVGAHERFDRLETVSALRDTTVWVDFEEGPLYGSLELWSDGAFGWNAGGGVIVQLSGVGDVRVYDRRGDQVPLQDFKPAIPSGGRVRLRLVKGASDESVLHLDSWDGRAFVPDWGVWILADDHRYRGLATVLADYYGGPRRFRRITVATEYPAAALALRKDYRGSADWKVFQRDGNDLAAVPVRFDHRLGDAGRIECRVVRSIGGSVLPGHDWTDHASPLAPAPEGGGGEIVLTGVPVGGNYDVEVRLVRDADGSVVAEDVLSEIAVGDVFLAGGQSNMSGYSGSLVGAEAPIDEVHLFGNDYVWKRAVEPMDDGTDQVDRVSSESPAHTLMLRFGKEIHASTGVPVGIVPGPLGGTNLHTQWRRDDASPGNRGTLYGSLLHRGLVQGYAVPIRGFLWYQGESDAGRSDYEANLKQLIANYRADLAAPDLFFGVVQLATYAYSNLEDWVALQEQQRRAVETTTNTILSAAVDLPRADVIHLDVAGYKSIGTRLAAEFREHLYGEAIDASARLLKATVTANGRAVELEYDREVQGGLPGLYRVQSSGTAVQVRSVSASGRFVTLELWAKVQTGASVSYGYSTDPAAAWVKDLAGTAVACFKDVPTTP